MTAVYLHFEYVQAQIDHKHRSLKGVKDKISSYSSSQHHVMGMLMLKMIKGASEAPCKALQLNHSRLTHQFAWELVLKRC